MENFAYKMKYHWAAVAIALILGALMVLPFFYFQEKLGADFTGIWPEVVDDQSFYWARAKDVMDGHPFLSNAYLAEHKEGLPQQLFLAEYLLAQPIKLLGISVQSGQLAYNFILPLIAFLLTYAALYLISKSRILSAIAAIFLFFGLYLMAFIRPISPQFNFIFWLTQFILLWLLINPHNNSNLQIYSNSTNKIRSIRVFIRRFGLLGANALNFGLLFYIYPYYWTFYLILFGLLAAVYFIYERQLSYKIMSIVGGGLLLAIPYFYFNYLASQLPYYFETLTRLGMIYTRFPSGVRTVLVSVVGLAILAALIYRKIINADAKTIFFGAGFLTSIIAVNQHLLTGKNFEFSSHYDIGAMFFLVFALAYLIGNYLKKLPNTTIHRCIVVFIVLILGAAASYGLFSYSRSVFAINENAVYQQNYSPILKWLNENTPEDSVVYANTDLSRLIPVYTANNVFYVREANLFFISDEEVLDRFILNNFFEKFNENFVTENVRSIYGTRYINAYGHAVQGNKLRRLLSFKPEPEIYLPEDAIQKVMTRAKESQNGNFAEEIKNYRADYLIWDKNKNLEWKIGKNNFDLVFQTTDVLIYKIR